MSVILDVVRPFFTNVPLLRDLTEAEQFQASSLRRQIVADVAQMESEAREKGVAAGHLGLIKYAVIAFTDEIAQAGPLGAYWTEHQIQSELLGESNAGQGFFLHLETLLAVKKAEKADLDVLEVYATCLFFGFRGKYAARVDATGFEALRKRVEAKLRERLIVDPLPEMERARRGLPPAFPTMHRWVAGLALLFSLLMLCSYRCELADGSRRLEEYLEAGAR